MSVVFYLEKEEFRFRTDSQSLSLHISKVNSTFKVNYFCIEVTISNSTKR